MLYTVHLAYFRPTGRFLAFANMQTPHKALIEIWADIVEKRRLGELPGLRPNAGRDLLILVDVAAHPERKLHMILPPFIGDDDVTPVHVQTGEMEPIVRLPLDEMPSVRTTTRDVIRMDVDDEVTPPDGTLHRDFKPENTE
jgi:hypothetical protein